MSGNSVVITTCGSEEEAKRVASGLIDARAAACVQAMPITSTFYWEGDVQQDQEVLLLIKTTDEKTEAVEKLIKSLHSYDVPEIIVLPITSGSKEYLTWMKKVVS